MPTIFQLNLITSKRSPSITYINEPQNVVAKQTSANQITISWENQEKNGKVFVERFDSCSGFWTKLVDGVDTLSDGDGSFIDTSVKLPLLSYFHVQYKVSFKKSTFESAQVLSNIISAKSHETFDFYADEVDINGTEFKGWGWSSGVHSIVKKELFTLVAKETFEIGVKESFGWTEPFVTQYSFRMAVQTFEELATAANVKVIPNGNLMWSSSGIIIADNLNQ